MDMILGKIKESIRKYRNSKKYPGVSIKIIAKFWRVSVQISFLDIWIFTYSHMVKVTILKLILYMNKYI